MAAPPDKFEAYRQILERAWGDANFRQRLKDNPKQVLQEYGVHISASDKIKILEDDDTLHLPPSHEDFIC